MLNLAVPAATGGAGTRAARRAAAVPRPPIPATFAGKLDEAKQLRADHTARFAALRVAPPAKTRKAFIEPITAGGGVDFRVVEEEREQPVSELLEEWRGPLELTRVEDVFNDHLDFGVDSWAKLEALNASMLPVMEKYKRLAQDSEAVIAETAAYVHNYRLLGDALASMEARAAGDDSVAAAVEEDLKAVKDRIAAIAAEHGATIRAPASRDVLVFPAAAGTAPAAAGGGGGGGVPAGIPLPRVAVDQLAGLGVTVAHLTLLLDSLRASGVPAPAFELLYQATTDGVTKAQAMRCCKDRGPVLIIGREATGGWLYGGYMDCGVGDAGAACMKAPQAFLFALTTPHGGPPTVWRRGTGIYGVGYYDASIVYFLESFWAKAESMLEWQANDTAGSTAYRRREPHHERTWTGAKSWTASDVLIYRV